MKKKTIIILVLVGFIFLLVLIRLGSKEESDKESVKISPTRIPVATITPASGFNAPNQISWGLEEEIILPEKTIRYTVKERVISDENAINLAKILGLEGEINKLDDGNILVFYDDKDSVDFHINNKKMEAEYSKNLLISPLLTDSKKEWEDVDKMSQKLVDLLSNGFLAQEEMGLSVIKIEYEKTKGPRFVESDKKTAEIVEFKLIYSLEGQPIFYNQGAPISARYSKNGELIKLIIKLPSKFVKKEEMSLIKTMKEVELSKAEEFVVLDVDGTSEFDLSSQEEVIERTIIESGYFGYLYLSEKEELIPYFFVNGKSSLSTGLIDVFLGINLLTDE
ncbi:hypothetical protein KKC08_00160 [Patescibacteria group bacterium]|nr:hypothetical protein [Patescibacteria group bacterium]MCG2701697.1 hypothetical protein [Candidatus Parcubacteria bacterium]MBU4265368.1 hypothetical protein [Patescibacteria group bacterium]MBU4390320.1 hypothetical protein [Patescibacteria group bacterium]MBU4396567.1 hypothetical protein [Patescibacteria group bacterium]